MSADTHFAFLTRDFRFSTYCVVAVLLGCSEIAQARREYRDALFAVYPSAVGTTIETVPSRVNHCGACHYRFNGGGQRNPYGARLEQELPGHPDTEAGWMAAVRAIETLDSDADGFNSRIEITDRVTYSNTPTFPGLSAANVANVVNVSLADIQDHLTPVTAADTTPPQVTVVEPNGGETLTANRATTIRWIATDAGGVAAVAIYYSEGGGSVFRPVALGLDNSGQYEWFPANRPTSQARIRVTATDNSSNTGQDVSNAVFAVQSPSGGIVPTTLRDFDMPGSQPFDTRPILPSMVCSACHGGYNANVEPHFNWQGSMMAQAARDPLFEAAMTIANQDAPDSGDLCLRCHLPNGWLQGRSVPTDGSRMLPSDRDGVSCDLCHRMVELNYDVNELPPNPPIDASILAALLQAPSEVGNGMYVIDPEDNRRGPFADTVADHDVLVSPFHREAAICGTCHDVSNPAFERDGHGNFVPNALDTLATSPSAHTLMPVERTYSEWLASEYNTPTGVYAPELGWNRRYVASCQDCHLHAVTGKGCNNPSAPTRQDLPLHDMTGGSTWIPGLLAAMYPDEVNESALQAGITRARRMLQLAASIAAEQEGDELKVTVTNQTGHKLPTGYPEGRRIWINVKFLDRDGTLLSESGAYDAQIGVLTHDAEAKVYEAKPGMDETVAGIAGVEPGPTFHFVLNNKVFKDNRIPPRGFTNAAFAEFGGEPVGHAYSDGQYWDETRYSVPLCAASAVVTLNYQSLSKEHVDFLRDENSTDGKGDLLHGLWSSNGRCPPEAMATLAVPIQAPVPGDLDADCDVDFGDLILLLPVLLGADQDPERIARADLNRDASADGLDIQWFVRDVLGS